MSYSLLKASPGVIIHMVGLTSPRSPRLSTCLVRVDSMSILVPSPGPYVSPSRLAPPLKPTPIIAILLGGALDATTATIALILEVSKPVGQAFGPRLIDIDWMAVALLWLLRREVGHIGPVSPEGGGGLAASTHILIVAVGAGASGSSSSSSLPYVAGIAGSLVCSQNTLPIALLVAAVVSGPCIPLHCPGIVLL